MLYCSAEKSDAYDNILGKLSGDADIDKIQVSITRISESEQVSGTVNLISAEISFLGKGQRGLKDCKMNMHR